MVVDLPLVPGHGDERAVGCIPAPLPHEQLDIADDLHAGGAGEIDAPMRFRVGQRHAGRQHQGGKARPIGLAQIADGNTGLPGFGNPVRVVVRGHHIRPALKQRVGGRDTGTAETEQCNPFSLERRDRNHRVTAA